MIWADRILANWGEATEVLHVETEDDMKDLYNFTVESIALSAALRDSNHYLVWCNFFFYLGAPICRIVAGANMVIWPATQYVHVTP